MGTLAFSLALLAVLVMGMAIQRGATCVVAAVEEAVLKRNWQRSGALAEASFWSAGMLLVAAALGAGFAFPQAFEAGWMPVAGGMLLGLGAWLNGACVFGAIARLGNGELRMTGTLLGYLAGTLLFASLGEMRIAARQSDSLDPMALAPLGAAAGTLILLRLFMAWRSSGFTGPRKTLANLERPWPATVVIGITFAAAYMLVGGNWTWMDAFNALPQGDLEGLGWRAMLFTALVAGALIGGIRAGRLKFERPRLRPFLACLAGGTMMAVGSLLIPGYNDGLALLGAPLALPHAVLALAAMLATVASAILLDARRHVSG